MPELIDNGNANSAVEKSDPIDELTAITLTMPTIQAATGGRLVSVRVMRYLFGDSSVACVYVEARYYPSATSNRIERKYFPVPNDSANSL